MRRYFAFVGVGLISSELGEVANQIFAQRSPGGFLFTWFAYTFFLSLAFAGSAVLDRVLGRRVAADILGYALFGGLGLMVEWFLIGNSPWGAPGACQPGMFTYWGSLFLLPRFILDSHSALIPLKWTLIIYAVIMVALLLALGFLVDATIRPAVMGLWLVVAYLPLNLFYARYLSLRRSPRFA